MKYYEVKFSIKAPEELMQAARDITSALAGEAGFESFEETTDGINGYVQQSLLNKDILQSLFEDFPLPDSTVDYIIQEAEDRDWNEQWEQEGFAPIIIEKRCIIHDGRHVDQAQLASYPIQIEIDAKQAFGTGTHETTQMVVSTLLDMNLNGKHVLDCGTGTGILSIAALKNGAVQAMGYDIDEWSVDNARHNAVINCVDDKFNSFLGDATLLDSCDEKFEVIVANINRNILLADLPRFCQVLQKGGTIILSGFYVEDIPLLQQKAETLGLTLTMQKNIGEWACITCK